ncbi:hypothetical protein H257_14940 [Aphanomyces astaci]|uniref:Uncharacterized protein n=1 Tax=Aphanomyces astaci TaxID=112090 RepID=W4FRN1_APHAT|nr:hypothetical protein H257_14940 [Aphanomyces astaci]ETV69318.1 hypothetical protein H257_14940 [Aphanomyces astaci]|eukprot:XP_009841175.1 hypothetical protein H257_14940 [Aphanomyces astaci]
MLMCLGSVKFVQVAGGYGGSKPGLFAASTSPPGRRRRRELDGGDAASPPTGRTVPSHGGDLDRVDGLSRQLLSTRVIFRVVVAGARDASSVAVSVHPGGVPSRQNQRLARWLAYARPQVRNIPRVRGGPAACARQHVEWRCLRRQSVLQPVYTERNVRVMDPKVVLLPSWRCFWRLNVEMVWVKKQVGD